MIYREIGRTRLKVSEIGAAEFSLNMVCLCSVERKGSHPSFGILFFARAARFGALPTFEMAERVLRENMPERLTYPHIQPIFQKKCRSG